MAQNMSFLPEDYVEQKVHARTNVICLTLFIIVMGGVIAAWMVTDHQRREVRHLQSSVNRQFEDAAQRIEQFNQLQGQKEKMLRKAKVTSVLIERIPRSVILAELINHMPATLSLLEFELETKVIKRPVLAHTALEQAKEDAKYRGETLRKDGAAVKLTEVSMELVGVAPTDVQVAQYMTALGRSSLFRSNTDLRDNLNLIFSEQVMIEDQEMRRFRIELKLNQHGTAEGINAKRVRRELQMNPMADTIQIDPNGQFVLPANATAAVPVPNNLSDTTEE